MKWAADGSETADVGLGQEDAVQAQVGDTITLPGRTVGQKVRTGRVLTVHDAAGNPPFLVRWADGHEALCYPPPEAKVEPGSAGS